MIEFSLNSESNYIELCQLLKVVGLCQTGGDAKHFIREGHVFVDGRLETRNACKIYAGQQVEFYGKLIKVLESAPNAAHHTYNEMIAATDSV